MRRAAFLLLLVCQTTFGADASVAVAPAPAEKRVALVIGNAAYSEAPLKNPLNDAEDIAAKLRSRGFEVVERRNLKTSQIGRTLREFRSRLAKGAVALVFYAGHGLQIKGENFLPTVDADIEGEEDVPNQSLSVRQILELLDDSKTRLNLVFLDACRNNPYARRFRSTGGGLARETVPGGTLISFATRPGSVAADGSGRNGLYTQYLLQAMDTPNLPVELALKQVVTGVKTASKGAQEPWMEGSIDGDFYFLPQSTAGGAMNAAQQQETINRAVEEAVRRANEQSARERAELQSSMERMLKEALAKQNAQLEAERRQRESLAVAAPAVPAPVTMAAPAPSAENPPKTTGIATTAIRGDVAPGDEWEYVARDLRFGRKARKLVLRVKAATQEGALEEIEWEGTRFTEWVFGSQPAAIGSPNEAEFLFAPHWDGTPFKSVVVEGGAGLCARTFCEFRVQRQSRERLTVPAGTFDAVRLDGWLYVRSQFGENAETSIWYAPETRRLLKQTVDMRGIQRSLNFNETLELSAIRRAVR